MNIRKRYFCSCNEIITNVKIFKTRKKKLAFERSEENSSKFLQLSKDFRFDKIHLALNSSLCDGRIDLSCHILTFVIRKLAAPEAFRSWYSRLEEDR